MAGDTPTEDRVAALNVHHIISRAARVDAPASARRKNSRNRVEKATGTGAGRKPKAK